MILYLILFNDKILKILNPMDKRISKNDLATLKFQCIRYDEKR